MKGITAIILTKDEEVNIADCIESIQDFVDRIVVVDSGSTDETVEIARNLGADIFYHPWRHYADQFNWALENVGITTKWVYRIDADEKVPESLAREILKECENHSEDDINAFLMNHKLFFLGKYLNHGGSNLWKITVFKFGKGKFEDRFMGEHIVLNEGTVLTLKNSCLHHNRKDLTTFINKHNSYSSREVLDYYARQNSSGQQAQLYELAEKAQQYRDNLYYRLPKFIRAKLYYWYRYYIQLGFLDGKPGKIYCFIQAYIYRWITDAKIYEHEVNKK